MDVLLFEKQSIVLLVWSERILGTEDGLATVITSTVCGIDIIVITDMIHVTALQSRVWLIDNPLRGTDGIEVFIQLGHTDFIVSCYHKAASRCLI